MKNNRANQFVLWINIIEYSAVFHGALHRTGPQGFGHRGQRNNPLCSTLCQHITLHLLATGLSHVGTVVDHKDSLVCHWEHLHFFHSTVLTDLYKKSKRTVMLMLLIFHFFRCRVQIKNITTSSWLRVWVTEYHSCYTALHKTWQRVDSHLPLFYYYYAKMNCTCLLIFAKTTKEKLSGVEIVGTVWKQTLRWVKFWTLNVLFDCQTKTLSSFRTCYSPLKPS